MSDSPDQSARRDAYRKEGIAWCLSVFTAVLTYVGLAIVVNRYYQPDTYAAVELAARLSVAPSSVFVPEPKEKTLFLLGVTVLPLAFVVFYHLGKRLLATLSPSLVRFLFSALFGVSFLAVVALGYAGFTADNPFHLEAVNSQDEYAITNLQFYFRQSFIYEHPVLYALVLFPLIAILLWDGRRWLQRLPLLRENITSWFCNIWCFGLIVLVLVMNTFRFPYTYPNKYDFSAVFYPMVQVFGGEPLLVDGFTTTYGLYPHFLVPVFKLIGLSVLTFSGVMAALTAISFLLLFLFLRRQLSSAGILLCCFSSVVFYSYLYSKLVTPFDAIFAYQPIRFLFPMISLCLCNYYLTRRSRHVRTFSLLLLAAGILWNPEFGTLTYLGFVVFLLATEFVNSDRRLMTRNMLGHLAASLICGAVIFSCYALTIRLSYGSFPELFKMFSTYRVFSELGLNMLPMPVLHPWNLLALVFLLGIATFLVAVLNRSATDRHVVILFVTLQGIGALMYYQGRSHNWNLLASSVYAFILMALFSESLRSTARTERLYLLPWMLLVFALSGSVCQLAYASRYFPALVTEQVNKNDNQAENDFIYENARFIRDHSRNNEKILIITRDYFQSYYYNLSHTVAAINPGLLDLFWREDYNRIVRFLAFNKDVKVFFEPIEFKRIDNMIDVVLSSQYKVVASNGNINLLMPNK